MAWTGSAALANVPLERHVRRDFVGRDDGGRAVYRDVSSWAIPDPPAIAAQRLIATRCGFEARSLFRAADELESCGRDWIWLECSRGHGSHVPRRCQLSTLCPDCARARSAALAEIYTRRIEEARAGLPDSMRPRLVTFALRPNPAEAPDESYERCRLNSKAALRILFGVPSGKREWSVYFDLYPISDKAIAAAKGSTEAGRRRAAFAERRRWVQRQRLRRLSGWIGATEFGGRGLKAHTHAFVLGRYVPQAQVSRCWHLLTGSPIADIRVAHSVREVLKYCVKFTDRSPEVLAQLYRATCGRRRIEAAGCLRGKTEAEREAERAAPQICMQVTDGSVCGLALVAVGVLPASYRAMGVTEPPESCRFRQRAPPAGLP